MQTSLAETKSKTAIGAPKSDSEQLVEILISAHLIDPPTAERALAIYQTQGRWVGSVLVELGAITPLGIAQALSNHLGLKLVDFSNSPCNLDAVKMLPESMARRFKAIPVTYLNGVLQIAMANPLDSLASDLIQARTGMHINRMVGTERDIHAAIDRYYTMAIAEEQTIEPGSKPPSVSPASSPKSKIEEDEFFHVDDLLRIMMKQGASDLHLSVGSAPTIRVDGELISISSQALRTGQMAQLIYAILTNEQIVEFEKNFELDFAYSIPGLSRFRVNVHRQRGSVGTAFRAIPVDPPSLDGLGMPDVIKVLTSRPRGLVLVTGPTGSGKSTTLAAMIREINSMRRCHIVTVEDPIEFLHRNDKSIVIQREVGADTKSFAAALRHVLRQDPDVILIGEMRDLETISAALTAAETGHLVLATLHTTSAAQTVDRIVDVFPPHQQEQVRVQLSTVLEGILCQTLIPLADGKGRVCAQEILVATSAIRNLVREGKTHQMPSVLQSSASEGMQTLDQALKVLVKSAKISPAAAMAVASNPQDFSMFLTMR